VNRVTCDVVDGEDPGDDILDMVLEEFSLSRAMEIMGKFTSSER